MEIYLDNAATSHPKPACTLRAVQDAMTRFNANPGRAGHARSLAAGRLVLEARETLARALGARDPFCVVHAFNCTDALNLAIKGCLKRGDHVVSTMLEHNSVLRVLMEKQKRGEIAVTLVRPRGYFVDARDVQRALRPNTRLIAVTHASNVTGAVQPVEEICQLEPGGWGAAPGRRARGRKRHGLFAVRLSRAQIPAGPHGHGRLVHRARACA